MRDDKTCIVGDAGVPPELVQHELIGEPVKAVSADVLAGDIARQAGQLRELRQAGVKGRIEAGDLREFGPANSNRNDAGDIVRQMQRRERDQPVQVGFQLRCDQSRTGAIRTAMYDPVADCGDRTGIIRVGEEGQQCFDRLFLIGD
jgi:hypothetical protein